MPNSLRIFLKILFFPVRMILKILTGAMTFIMFNPIIIIVLNIISGICFIFFLVMTWSAIFATPNTSIFLKIFTPSLPLLASYIINPTFGALKYIGLLIERLEDLNEFLKLEE